MHKLPERYAELTDKSFAYLFYNKGTCVMGETVIAREIEEIVGVVFAD